MGKHNMVSHDFYCMNCGKKAIPLARPHSLQRGKFHRKKLYCPWCKNVVNHIEIKNNTEKEEFLDNFQKGVYIDEAKESLCCSGDSGFGQVDIFKKYC